ncbi:MAG: binding-protein-dependent transport system inner rane component [Thermomicrobiales bacterium]|nr:binding-protein-dependent transport system inner rane component [Thermomicrobiales bacterium]
MGSYVFNRLLQFVPTLFVVSVVVFLMVRAIPGDASYALLGPTAKPEQIAALRAEMGLDEPMIAVLIAIPMGILPALRPGSWIERVAALYNGLMLAIPTFWLGVLLVLVISLRLGWLPPSGYVPFGEDPVQSIKLLILPSFTLGAYLSAIFARFLHNAMTETLSQDYVRTAAAKGLAERLVVRRHVLRNALIPVVTMLGIQFGGLLGGAVIVEAIFDWPGLGRLLVTSISSRDYAVVQGTILLAASAFLFVNLLTDLTYGLLDPRIRTAE